MTSWPMHGLHYPGPADVDHGDASAILVFVEVRMFVYLSFPGYGSACFKSLRLLKRGCIVLRDGSVHVYSFQRSDCCVFFHVSLQPRWI